MGRQIDVYEYLGVPEPGASAESGAPDPNVPVADTDADIGSLGFKIGSLFSGACGGLEFGLELAGLGEVVWQVEKDEWRRGKLALNWPGVRRYDDVCRVGARVGKRSDGGETAWALERVDLICGGFPCQDVSSAGKGAGLGGARSGLWWEFDRIVGELRPAWVVVENVASGADKWVDAVRWCLALRNYETLPVPLSASSVGAPHARERVFIVGRWVGDGDGVVERLLADLGGVVPDVAWPDGHPGAVGHADGVRGQREARLDDAGTERGGVTGTGAAGPRRALGDAGRLGEREPNEEASAVDDGRPRTRRAFVRASVGDADEDGREGVGEPGARPVEGGASGPHADGHGGAGPDVFAITCDCGAEFVGRLSDACPRCGEIRGGYTNELGDAGLDEADGEPPCLAPSPTRRGSACPRARTALGRRQDNRSRSCRSSPASALGRASSLPPDWRGSVPASQDRSSPAPPRSAELGVGEVSPGLPRGLARPAAGEGAAEGEAEAGEACDRTEAEAGEACDRAKAEARSRARADWGRARFGLLEWPAGRGREQHAWEPPRVIPENSPENRRRLAAFGDSVVPQMAEVVGWVIRLLIEGLGSGSGGA